MLSGANIYHDIDGRHKGISGGGICRLGKDLRRVQAHRRRMFATLDPSSRRLRFPEDMEVIITDTVGFIRDLPKGLTARL